MPDLDLVATQPDEPTPTDTHDAVGPDHLLMWADDYLRRGLRIEASALIVAARELLMRRPAVQRTVDRETITRALTNQHIDYGLSGGIYLGSIDAAHLADLVLAVLAPVPVVPRPTRDELAKAIHDGRMKWVGGGDGAYDLLIADAVLSVFPGLTTGAGE